MPRGFSLKWFVQRPRVHEEERYVQLDGVAGGMQERDCKRNRQCVSELNHTGNLIMSSRNMRCVPQLNDRGNSATSPRWRCEYREGNDASTPLQQLPQSPCERSFTASPRPSLPSRSGEPTNQISEILPDICFSKLIVPHKSTKTCNGLKGLRIVEREQEVDAVLLLPTREPSAATTASTNSAASTFSANASAISIRSCSPGMSGESALGQVTLNIYDLGQSQTSRAINRVFGHVGMGVFHCGVEIYGREWSFRKCPEGSGVFACRPRCCPGHHFSESIPMGHARLNKTAALRLISTVSQGWHGTQYSMLRRNCCHFSREFCRLLEVDADFPPRILAAATAAAHIEEAGVECWASLHCPHAEAEKGNTFFTRCCCRQGPSHEEEDREDIHVVEPSRLHVVRPQ